MFLRLVIATGGFTIALSTTPHLQAQVLSGTVNLSIVGTGAGKPGNFNINTGGSAIIGFGSEFDFDFSNFRLQVDVFSNDFQLQFVRTTGLGDLSGPVTWTLSFQNLNGGPNQIVGLTPLSPTFAAPLAVDSYGVINGYTVDVTTGQTTDLTGGANQNAHFQVQLAPVPEPSTLATCSWLAGAGLCWCWRKGRRSRAIAGA
jgi:hypothetical protein